MGAFSYQWKQDGVLISGTTASTFTHNGQQVGKVISFVTSYTDGAGIRESVAAAPTPVVENVLKSQLAVSQVIADLNVSLNISHIFDGDLTISLSGPLGIEVVLTNRVGGAGAIFVSTVFDDEAATLIGAGSGHVNADGAYVCRASRVGAGTRRAGRSGRLSAPQLSAERQRRRAADPVLSRYVGRQAGRPAVLPGVLPQIEHLARQVGDDFRKHPDQHHR